MNFHVRCKVCGDKFLYEEQPYRIKACCRDFDHIRFIVDARQVINEKQLDKCFAEVESNDRYVGEVIISLPFYVALVNNNRLDRVNEMKVWGAKITLYSDELLIIEEENRA